MPKSTKPTFVMASLHHRGEEGTSAEAWVCWLQAGRHEIDIPSLGGDSRAKTLRRIRAVAKLIKINVEVKE